MNNNDNYMKNNMNMNESLNAIGNDGFSDQCVDHHNGNLMNI